MKILKEAAHKILWQATAVVCVLSFLGGFTATVDIQMHDTYWVIDGMGVALGLCIYLAVVGLLYWFLWEDVGWGKELMKGHALLTAGIVILLMIYTLYLTFNGPTMLTGWPNTGLFWGFMFGAPLAVTAIVLLRKIRDKYRGVN